MAEPYIEQLAQGPTVSYRRRLLGRIFPSIAQRFFKTPLHSLFYDTPVVTSSGEPEYWRLKEERGTIHTTTD